MSIVEIQGVCARCEKSITNGEDLLVFRNKAYHKGCYPSTEEIHEMDNSYTFKLSKKPES